MAKHKDPVYRGTEELRLRDFPSEGKNMVKMFQKKINLTTKDTTYTFRQALFDMIEYAYKDLVVKADLNPKSRK